MALAPTVTPLSALDANFLALDSPTTHQAIAALCVCRGIPDRAVLRARVEQILRAFPLLTAKLQDPDGPHLKSPHWVRDDRFNLDAHIDVRSTAPFATREELLEVASEVFSRPLDYSRPLWRFTILDATAGLDEAAPRDSLMGGLIFQIHHALADGLGGIEILHRVCDTEDTRPDRVSRSTHASLAKFGEYRFWPSLRYLLRQAIRPRARSAVNGVNSAVRRIALVDLPLLEIKRMRAGLGASLNDIYLSLVAGAIRRYHALAEQRPHDICAIVPFNLRNAEDRNALGNHLSGAGLFLPVSEPDPINRVTKTRDRHEQLKTDGSFGALRVLARANLAAPNPIRRAVAGLVARRTNIICTNVPGPSKPLTIAGARIETHYGCAALMEGHGIAFAFLSYAGSVCVAVVSDPQIVPEPGVITQYVQEAFDELRACTAERKALRSSHPSGEPTAGASRAIGGARC